MPRKVQNRQRIPPIMVTDEILQEWIWLRQNQRGGDKPETFEWNTRYKKFYHALGIYWGDMCGPFEATTAAPLFDIARQPHRYETWLQGKAWRAALIEAEVGGVLFYGGSGSRR
jgi:hypothetical protein